jgi:hypothetical protein
LRVLETEFINALISRLNITPVCRNISTPFTRITVITKHYQYDKIKEKELGGEYSIHGGD